MLFRSTVLRKITPFHVAVGFFLFLAAFTRLVRLGEVPSGISWDEAALGYIGAMVDQTGRDEFNRLLPRVFESFGDFKAPLAMYITGISTSILGITAWSIRLPFALASIATTLVVTRISFLTFQKKWLSLATFWFTITIPWLFHFGRVAFESGLSLLFLSTAVLSWLEVRKKSTIQPFWPILFSSSLAASLYTYHSAKILVPALLFTIALHEWLFHRDWLKKQSKTLLFMLLGLALMLLPFADSIVNDNALGRASQTSIFSREGNPLLILGKNFLAHLDLHFLIGGKTDSLRHGTGKYGVFLFTHCVFFLLGITLVIGRYIETFTEKKSHVQWQRVYQWFKAKILPKNQQSISPIFWIALFLVGLLPAAIGFEVPHANRALFAALPAIMIMTFAVDEVRRDVSDQIFALVIGSLLLFQGLEFGSFYQHYFSEYKKQSSIDWMEGYTQAAQLAWVAHNNGEKIKFTSQYGQPEIFFAASNALPFDLYRWQRVPNITFGRISEFDITNYSYIVAGSDEELATKEPSHIIYRSNNEPAFYIYE